MISTLSVRIPDIRSFGANISFRYYALSASALFVQESCIQYQLIAQWWLR